MIRSTNFRPRSIQHDIVFQKHSKPGNSTLYLKKVNICDHDSVNYLVYFSYLHKSFFMPVQKNLKSGSFSIHHLMICQNKKSNSVENAYVTKIYLDFIGFTMEGELWKWTNYWNGT